MYRTIWIYYFVTGLLSLTAGVPVMDDWATTLLPVASDATCRLVSPETAFNRADLALCAAAGFNELRAATVAQFEVLFAIRGDMPAANWVHVADVLVILFGSIAAAIAMICVWANGMTRLAGVSLTGTYTLVRAIGLLLPQPRT